ncbi:MAG: HEAT repeat domain-containing protein [Chloroflexi bacterium]|nr:HEAT repeat domain-containing protein [Chloroflexota bacterium]
MPLERLLADLADEAKPVRHTALTNLSGLTPQETGTVKAAWAQIPVPRRRQVVTKLVELAEQNVELDFATIFKLCLQDTDGEVREHAIEGLWESEERALISMFITLLRCDPSERVRAKAAQALGKFTDLAEDGKLLPRDSERLRESLLEAFRDPEHPLVVRRRALEALAPLTLPDIKELIQQAYDSPLPLLSQSAIYAMGRNADPRWRPTILKALGSEDSAMRYEAACACAEMGEEAAVPHLLPLLRDEDTQAREAAIRALGSIGGSVAKKALLNCLKSSDEAVRQAAGEALQKMETAEDPLSFKHRL